MSHKQQRNFLSLVKNKYPNYFIDNKVLEIGSLDINGSVRSNFTGGEYIGIDVGEGRGVDTVCSGHEYVNEENYFDVSISCECFEHNPYWYESFLNMITLTRPGGLLVMTCATTGRKEHGTSRTTPNDCPLTIGVGWDYYKNLTESDFRDKINFDSYFSTHEFSVEKKHKDLFFVGVLRCH